MIAVELCGVRGSGGDAPGATGNGGVGQTVPLEGVRALLEAQRAAVLAAAPDGGGKRRKRVGPAVWVDVVAPTDEDWRRLDAEFGFHPLAVEDAQKQGQRPKVDSYEGYLFLSIPAWCGGDKESGDDAIEEVDIFLGPDYLVTIHSGCAPPLDEMRKRLARSPIRVGRHPAQLLYILLDATVDAYFPVMDAIDADIDALEISVYAADGGFAPIDVKPALNLKRRLLALRQAAAPMRDVLNALLREDDERLMPPDLPVFYQDVYDHTLRLTEQIDIHRDLLSSVLDAMVAQTNNRLNTVMKTLTAYSLATMGATLVAGVYGMNFEHMPELHWRTGYPLALGLMVLVFFGVVAYFKRKGWL
jgi:magnesium transporter